jgi:hypothetical protein
MTFVLSKVTKVNLCIITITSTRRHGVALLTMPPLMLARFPTQLHAQDGYNQL